MIEQEQGLYQFFIAHYASTCKKDFHYLPLSSFRLNRFLRSFCGSLVRMATSAEVANRSNVTAFVKPSDIPVASTTAQGIARFATATEVSNRTNVSAAITPANVGQTFGQSLNQNGWCRLPNGLILQWANITINTSPTSFTFPIAFPTACLVLNVGSGEDTTAQAEIMTVVPGSKTRTGFSATANAVSTYTYIAIGY